VRTVDAAGHTDADDGELGIVEGVADFRSGLQQTAGLRVGDQII
jgi:hypothetical protein